MSRAVVQAQIPHSSTGGSWSPGRAQHTCLLRGWQDRLHRWGRRGGGSEEVLDVSNTARPGRPRTVSEPYKLALPSQRWQRAGTDPGKGSHLENDSIHERLLPPRFLLLSEHLFTGEQASGKHRLPFQRTYSHFPPMVLKQHNLKLSIQSRWLQATQTERNTLQNL